MDTSEIVARMQINNMQSTIKLLTKMLVVSISINLIFALVMVWKLN